MLDINSGNQRLLLVVLNQRYEWNQKMLIVKKVNLITVEILQNQVEFHI